MTENRARLCLNMIVKNEAEIITRCLESVLPWIDAYVICDTGSEDGTPDMIRGLLEGIPGYVYTITFESFGQARNEALKLAQTSRFDFSHVLLTDADMELVVEDEDFRSKIVRPSYWIVQKSGGLAYDNTRIIGKHCAGEYKKRTHEFLQTFPPVRLEGCYFVDHADGKNRTDKYVRDEKLLLLDLEDSPDDPRTLFYLAETYRFWGKTELARKYYLQRSKVHGAFEEEAWYAAWRAAEMAKDLGDEPAFVHEILNAFQRRPSRVEPLRMLSQYWRERGKNDLTTMVAMHGLTIDVPHDDILFIDTTAYGPAMEQELAISGFYQKDPGRKALAREACMSLTVEPTASWDIRQTARRNSVHYAAGAESQCWMKMKEVRVPLSKDYVSALNPSVVWDEKHERLVGIVRTVNYIIDENGRYVMSDGGHVVRTRNRVAILGGLKHGELVLYDEPEVYAIEDHASDGRISNGRILGYEDVRLFRWKGAWWGSCTVRDRRGSEDAEIALLRFESINEDLDLPEVIAECVVQRDPSVGSNWIWNELGEELCPTCEGFRHADEDQADRKVHKDEDCAFRPRHEKNWAPVTSGDLLMFVYQHDPFEILNVDAESLQAKRMASFETRLALEHFRGGTQFIPYRIEDEHGRLRSYHLSMIHEAHEFNGRRTYLHRWVRTDEEMKNRRVSDPFYLHKRGIEFASGLAIVNGEVVVSFGVDDRKAMIGTTSVGFVHRLLEIEGRRT